MVILAQLMRMETTQNHVLGFFQSARWILNGIKIRLVFGRKLKWETLHKN